jgi:hypothetical protein
MKKNLRQCTDSDCGVCGWPWWFFALGKADRALLVISNRCVPVNNTQSWIIITFCARKILQLFAVVFCVVRAVQKFHFRIVTNETPNKRRPVERTSCSNTDSWFWLDLYVFPQSSSRVSRDSTHAVQVNCILLIKDVRKIQYILTLWRPERLLTPSTIYLGGPVCLQFVH